MVYVFGNENVEVGIVICVWFEIIINRSVFYFMMNMEFIMFFGNIFIKLFICRVWMLFVGRNLFCVVLDWINF